MEKEPKQPITNRREPPPRTPEEYETRMIGLAFDAAERRIRNNTASSQEICHFLKMGSAKEKYEREILKKEAELLSVKTEAIKSQKRVEELYTNALKAFRSYNGDNTEDNTEDDQNY